ncbi:hypothetical protein [Secundilactobacillus folii]|uniref:Transcriptional regulator n=1 Tax=Secundilactobacillus folii TaxID=2678357 RepID=A0A7X3C448_9LACO|nr:hypothetical protein [Secundilactobacillus folii]MTV83192.1 hypothetical protein [Secundilactobacillus folii]
MNDYERQHLESILRDYPRIDKYIGVRIAKLSYPYQGHSHVLSKLAVGTMLFDDCIGTDRCLVQLEVNKKCIDYCLKHSDSATRTIIEQLYFQHATKLTLDGIGMRFNMSKSNVSRKRTAFFEFLKQELGY